MYLQVITNIIITLFVMENVNEFTFRGIWHGRIVLELCLEITIHSYYSRQYTEDQLKAKTRKMRKAKDYKIFMGVLKMSLMICRMTVPPVLRHGECEHLVLCVN